MSLGMGNCQIVLLKKMELILGNQITDIRKTERKAKLTLTKDKEYPNILKNLAVLKTIVKKVSNVVVCDIL